MDVRRLKYFLTIARAGSISRAAKQLALSQPALSQQLSLLERELEQQLVERVGQGIRLTVAGTTLVKEAENLLEQFESLEKRIKSPSSLPPELSISAGLTLSGSILPGCIAALAKRFPETRIKLFESNNNQVEEQIKSTIADIALVSTKELGATIETSHLFDDTILPVVSKNHTLARKAKPTPGDCLSAGLLLYHQGSIIGKLSRSMFHNKDLQDYTAMTLQSLHTVIKCAEAGLGVAFMSQLSLTNKLVPLKIEGLVKQRSFYLAFRKSNQQTLQPAISYLQDLLIKKSL